MRRGDRDRRPGRKPWYHAPDRFFDQVGGEGETEADEAVAIDWIEIEPRSLSYARIAQQGFAEGDAVVGEMPDVGVDVEIAPRVGRGSFQRLDQ